MAIENFILKEVCLLKKAFLCSFQFSHTYRLQLARAGVSKVIVCFGAQYFLTVAELGSTSIMHRKGHIFTQKK